MTDNPMAAIHAANAEHDALDEAWLDADIAGLSTDHRAAISDRMADIDVVIRELQRDARAFIEHQLKPWGFTASHLRELYE